MAAFPERPASGIRTAATWGLGALTVLPLAYVVFFICLMVVTNPNGSDNGQLDLPFADSVLWTMHGAAMLLILVLAAVYVRDSFRNPRVPDERRNYWVSSLLLGNAITMPYYWWVYVRPLSARE